MKHEVRNVEELLLIDVKLLENILNNLNDYLIVEKVINGDSFVQLNRTDLLYKLMENGCLIQVSDHAVNNKVFIIQKNNPTKCMNHIKTLVWLNEYAFFPKIKDQTIKDTIERISYNKSEYDVIKFTNKLIQNGDQHKIKICVDQIKCDQHKIKIYVDQTECDINLIKYMIEQKYTFKLSSADIIDNLSKCGDVHMLNLLKNTLSKHEFVYTKMAIDGASSNGHIHVLEWWKNSGFELRYSKNAIYWSKTVAVLEWWKKSGLDVKFNVTNKFKRQLSKEPEQMQQIYKEILVFN